MSIFVKIIRHENVYVEGVWVFKLKRDAAQIAAAISEELGSHCVVGKHGKGWSIAGSYDAIECVWGVRGSRLTRIN